MQRIIIMGCPGSGKTYVAETLGEKLDISVIYLDKLWRGKEGSHISKEEFDARMEKALALDSWIMDGDFSRTMEARLKKCDTILYLNLPRWLCLWNLCKRAWAGRKDPNGEKLTKEKIRYVWNYRKNNRIRNDIWLAKTKHAKVVNLRTSKQVQAFLEECGTDVEAR